MAGHLKRVHPSALFPFIPSFFTAAAGMLNHSDRATEVAEQNAQHRIRALLDVGERRSQGHVGADEY